MLKGQKINEDELGDIVNNTDRSYLVGKQDYILLLKKQKDKNYSTLYVTDCEANFWIRKVDSEFFEELRASLNVNSDLGTFSRHFITSLGQKSRL